MYKYHLNDFIIPPVVLHHILYEYIDKKATIFGTKTCHHTSYLTYNKIIYHVLNRNVLFLIKKKYPKTSKGRESHLKNITIEQITQINNDNYCNK